MSPYPSDPQTDEHGLGPTGIFGCSRQEEPNCCILCCTCCGGGVFTVMNWDGVKLEAPLIVQAVCLVLFFLTMSMTLNLFLLVATVHLCTCWRPKLWKAHPGFGTENGGMVTGPGAMVGSPMAVAPQQFGVVQYVTVPVGQQVPNQATVPNYGATIPNMPECALPVAPLPVNPIPEASAPEEDD